MVVVVASDNNYASILGCSLCSLYINNMNVDSIFVYVINDNISNENIKVLNKITDKYGRKIIYIEPPNISEKIAVKGTLNVSTYYRLFLCSLIDKEIEKVLYLDCDTLVIGDLSKLWNLEMKNKWIAGVLDITGQYARESVELKKTDVYVNAGVLLINLKRWREEQIELKFSKYLASKNGTVEYNDQGVINHVCKGKKIIINPCYNYTVPYNRYMRSDLIKITGYDEFYSAEDLKLAREHPIIVHFAGYPFNRPWFIGARGRFINNFMYYWKESGMQNKLLIQPSNLKYRIRKVCDKLPDKICIKANSGIDYLYRISVQLRNKKNS